MKQTVDIFDYINEFGAWEELKHLTASKIADRVIKTHALTDERHLPLVIDYGYDIKIVPTRRTLINYIRRLQLLEEGE